MVSCREKGKISASLMCANFDEIPVYLEAFTRNEIEFLHVDVMDGSFVPNMAFGPDFVKRLRQLTDIKLDCHLMVDAVENKLAWFDFQPGEQVSIHYEATRQVHKCLDFLLERGAKPFLALNPHTPVDVLTEFSNKLAGVLMLHVNPGFAGQKLVPHTVEKVVAAKQLLRSLGRDDILIESDGNITFENAEKLYARGADIFVAGTSSIFRNGDIDELIRKKRSMIGW